MNRHAMKLVLFLGLLSTLFFSQGVRAGGHDSKQGLTDWTVRLGAMGMVKPAYEGSNDYEFQAFPMIDVAWKNVFLNARQGLGAYVWDRDGLKIGLSLGWIFGRDEGDSPDLAGLGDLDGGLSALASAKWTLGDLSLGLGYESQATGESAGFQIQADAGYAIKIGRKILLRPSAKAAFSSDGYMEKHFGVSASQSSRSGLAAYDTRAGLKSAGLGIMALYRIDRRWGIQTLASWERLMGDAADSPVTREEHTYFLSLGFSYMF
jgi:MipA family protein